MNFSWNEDTMRWYMAADEYTGFFKNIAETISPMLQGAKSFCDVGCGLALTDFALYPLLERIDCVDINEVVLDSVKKRAKALGIHNIFPRKADADELKGRWDVVFVSFFGGLDLDKYLPLCKKLIAVVGVNATKGIYPQKGHKFKKAEVTDVKDYLEKKGLSYRLICRKFEFGQPFTSLDDAMAFLNSYSEGIKKEEAESFLSENMVKTKSEKYPLFIPRMKSLGIFELEGAL